MKGQSKMQIQTTEGTKSVGAAGVSNTALGLGIAGTVLGLGALNNGCNGNNGVLGNLFGGNNNGNGGCNQITQDTRYISALESEIGMLKSERYTDSVGIDLYKQIIAQSKAEDDKINANYKELAQFIAALDKDIAVYKQASTDNFAYLDKKIDCESQKLRCYVDATFVPGKLVMPLSSICPPAQPATTTTAA